MLHIWLEAKRIRCFICSSPLVGAGRTITPQQDSLRRFIIRADVHYDADSKLLTAHLELPGLKKRDLSITLSTCLYNRVRQIVIAGRSKPMLPETGYAIKERKFGEFSRTFAVPPETKVSLSTYPLLLLLTLRFSFNSRKMSRQKCRMVCLSLKYQWAHPPNRKTRKRLPFDDLRQLTYSLNRKSYKIPSGKRTAVYRNLPVLTLCAFSVTIVIRFIHGPQSPTVSNLHILDSRASTQSVQPPAYIYSWKNRT
jgi:HSP20 family molecular chaperone IbpA